VTDGVLFIHAFPMDARMWDHQVRAVDAPSLAVDLPGFGGTELAGDVMTMTAAAERCIEELDAAGLDRAVVCGLSMGGYVAFELWRRQRTRVMGFVLANTRAEDDTEEGKTRRREVAELVLEQGTVAILDSMRTLVSLEAADELWEQVASIVAAQPPEAVAAASLGMAARPNSRPDLGTITVPTLVITASGDQLLSPALSESMAAAIPGSELAVIEGAGHLSNLERPEEFNRLLTEHLRRCGLR
jgi:3-oxoadipate enol-lactonase